MRNEIFKENGLEKDLGVTVIGKLSGEQILMLTGIAVVGSLSLINILCSNGYDISVCNGGVSIFKHDDIMPIKAA